MRSILDRLGLAENDLFESTARSRGLDRERARSATRGRNAESATRRAEARNRAAAIWETASPTSNDHAYLLAKAVKPHGIRQHDGKLVVPMRDETGDLHSLQFIDAAGDKRFLPGGRKSGCYFAIGRLGSPLCIVEGFATGASIHEATGHAVTVAFDAGNLELVVRGLRARFPDHQLIVCADDDSWTDGNPGLTKANATAQAVGGLLAVPDFGESRPNNATDFNDLHRLRGAEAVMSAVRDARVPIRTTDRTSEHDLQVDDCGGWEWPEPGSIRAPLRPVPPFDPEVLLPEVLRAWVMDEADRMPTAPDFIAVAALVALATVIGARCAIKPKAKDDWLIIPNLWGGVVAPPSAKKSPAIGVALRPLDRLVAQAMSAHSEEAKRFQSDMMLFMAKKDGLEYRIKRAARDTGGKAESLEAVTEELREHQDSAPDLPILRRYKTNDSTIEKLGELLRANPDGLLVLRDELVGLLASWDREGREGDRTFFLEAWNGDSSFHTDRIGRGSIVVPNLCLSIFGGIQPDKLTSYLEQAAHALSNDGMLQRFQLLVYPDDQRWEWRDRLPDRKARNLAFAVFETLAGFEPESWGAAPADQFTKFPHFSFDDKAQSTFIEWSTDLHQTRLPGEDHPIVAQHLAKYNKLFPALALILHLVDCAATGARGRVSAEAAMRAAAWCEYLEGHARRCYGLLMDDGLRAALALAEKVRKGKVADGFTARDVRRNGWQYLTNRESVQAAIEWLVEEDWLRIKKTGGQGPGTGQPTRRCLINPKIRSRGRWGTANTDDRDSNGSNGSTPSHSGDSAGAGEW